MYYTGNELYRYLVEQRLTDRYFWVTEDMWTLLYSDTAGQPLLLCFVSRVEYDDELDSPAAPEEICAFRRFCLLADQADLPLVSLRFTSEFGCACENFRFKRYRSGRGARRLTSAQLLEQWKDLGLPLREEIAGKPVNGAPSSSFHLWQRAHMGRQVIATDLDLIEFSGHKVDTLYELKRSYKSLEEWEPYRDDRVNYLAGAMLAKRLGAKYRLVYNVRHTQPEFEDDISRLKVYDMNEGWPGKCLGQFAVEEYFK